MHRIVFFAAIVVMAGCVATGTPTNQTNTTSTSPADILSELQSNPEAKFSEQSGWKVAKLASAEGEKVWYFPPSDHAANPAVVIQTISEDSGGMTRTKTDAICSISQEVCNKLLSDFRKAMSN